MSQPHLRYARYLETLTPAAIGTLREHVREDVRFKDPFNDVTGVDAMAGVLEHMFAVVDDLSFVVR